MNLDKLDAAEPVPFTDAELQAARTRIQVRRFTEAMTGFVNAWNESVRQEMARLAEERKRAAERAAVRERRIDAAVVHLLRLEREASGEAGERSDTKSSSVDLPEVTG